MVGTRRRTQRAWAAGLSWKLVARSLLLLLGLATVARAQLSCDDNGVCVFERGEEAEDQPQLEEAEELQHNLPSSLEVTPAPEQTCPEDSSSSQEEEQAVHHQQQQQQQVEEPRRHEPEAATSQQEEQQQQQEQEEVVLPDGSVRLQNAPRAVKLGHVLENLAHKVPAELPEHVVQGAGRGQALLTRAYSRVKELLAPHVSTVHQFSTDLGLRAPSSEQLEALLKACEAGGASGGASTACHLLDVSHSLFHQLARAGRNASSSASAWISREVPEVSIPFHLLWVEVDVSLRPLSTASDVKAILLKQRPFMLVRLLDRLSSVLVRMCHAVGPLDYLINARYDLFYWPDPACPLEPTAEGVLARAPLTSDGFCVIRPCEAQASLPGQQGTSPFCECDLPQRQCVVRVEALRSFSLAVDGPLVLKPALNANCSTSVVYATPPRWLPEQIKPWVSGVPASVVSLGLGVLLAMLAEPLSESALVHVAVSALLGLFSLLILAAFVLNQLLRTVRSMQQLSTLTTVLSSVAMFLALQRFSAVSPTQQALALLRLAWSDWPVGRGVLLGACLLGVGLKAWFGWFTEPEDEAVGVLGRLMNGRLWLRRLAQLSSLWLVLQAAPNPDWAAVLGLLFLASSSISYWLYRAHMALHASPDASRFVQALAPSSSSLDEFTKKELQKLRDAMKEQPGLLDRLSEKTRFRAGEFRDGRDHILPADVEGHDDLFGPAAHKRGACSVQ